jgi:hypothetical protein
MVCPYNNEVQQYRKGPKFFFLNNEVSLLKRDLLKRFYCIRMAIPSQRKGTLFWWPGIEPSKKVSNARNDKVMATPTGFLIAIFTHRRMVYNTRLCLQAAGRFEPVNYESKHHNATNSVAQIVLLFSLRFVFWVLLPIVKFLYWNTI